MIYSNRNLSDSNHVECWRLSYEWTNEWMSEYLMPESLVFSYAKEINYCAVHIANYITYTHAFTVSYRALHWEVQTLFACDHYLIWSPVGMPWINPCATTVKRSHIILFILIISSATGLTRHMYNDATYAITTIVSPEHCHDPLYTVLTWSHSIVKSKYWKARHEGQIAIKNKNLPAIVLFCILPDTN